MVSIKSNGSKWAGEQPDSIDKLIEVLSRYTLDPAFEAYGNFISLNPVKWTDGTLCYPDNPNTVSFFGNFHNLSHVFSIDTDEPVLTERLSKAIRANQTTEAYQKARRS